MPLLSCRRIRACQPGTPNRPGLPMSVALLALLAFALGAANAPAHATTICPPPYAFSWGYSGSGWGQFTRPAGVAVNAAGDVYVADSGNNRVQKFMRDGNGLAAWGSFGTGPNQFFNVQGIAIDAQDNIYIADIGGGLSKYGPGEVFLYRRTLQGAEGVAVSADGYVYVVSAYQNRVVKYLASTGVVELDFGRLGTGDGRLDTPVDVACLPGGDVLVADMRNRRIQRFTANGVYVSQWQVYSGDGYGPMSPVGLTTDAQGNVYVMASGSGYNIHKFTADGLFLCEFGPSGNTPGFFSSPQRMAMNRTGDIYITDWYNDRVQMFGTRLPSDNPPAPPGPPPPPPDPNPVPPPPPTAGHGPALMLHAVAGSPTRTCNGPTSLGGIVTHGLVSSDGTAHYFVYLLATPDTREWSPDVGVGGLQCGIEFPTAGARPPIEMLSWTPCAVMEFPQPAWPASGTGNTITWGTAGCRVTDVAVGGYFYLAAYSPAALSLTNHPAVGAAKVANCRGSESTVDLTLNATQLGWISFGGAAKGLARLGCNSGVRACVENAPVAVKPMTWGGIKALFAK